MADAAEPQADGYYGDGDMGNEELDLSFLDQENDEETQK